MSLQELHEKLLSWATAEARKDALLEARRSHFLLHGEPSEEDKSFEPRMNAMLDAYLYDHRAAGSGERTIEAFIREQGPELTTDVLALYRALGKNLHGLFELKRLAPGQLRLRDCFTDALHEVTERRQMAGLSKGDLLEARLLSYEGRLYFSGAFLYHPREVRRAILAEVKRLRKAAGKGGHPDVEAFLAQLSRMALKLERYRNVRVESLYDFKAESRKPSPGTK